MAANAPDTNSVQEIKEDAAIDKATIVKETAKPPPVLIFLGLSASLDHNNDIENIQQAVCGEDDPSRLSEY